MKRRPLRALNVGLLAIAASGCASNGAPPERSASSLVPQAVHHFSTDAASSATATVKLATSDETEDGWRPAGAFHPIEEVGPRGDIILSSALAPVPPAPPSQPADDSTASEPTLPLPQVLGSDAKPIDLGSALALVASQSPEVNFARARVRETYASLDAADALWLPSLQFGANYYNHQGQLQDVGGRVLNINRSALNAGLGAGAVGAGTMPRPGLVMNFHMADAIFAPEIARRSAWASRHAVDAAVNDQLLAVAFAYLDLLEAHQQLAIALSTQENIDELVTTTEEFARTGQGLLADAERAVTERALRQNAVLQAEEAVASARLAELLRLDPTVSLQPCEAVVVPIELCDSSSEPRDLVATALARRPELREQRALVDAAIQRLKREKYAPLVPSILLGASYSGFGGGIGADISDFGDRSDFDALALWQIRGLGFGERAARAEASARIDQARFRQLQTMDRVAREVVEAKSQVEARRQQIAVAANAIKAAENSYRLNLQRTLEVQGLPIETLQAVQALDAARREYLRAVTDYNEAQFRLHRATGWVG